MHTFLIWKWIWLNNFWCPFCRCFEHGGTMRFNRGVEGGGVWWNGDQSLAACSFSISYSSCYRRCLFGSDLTSSSIIESLYYPCNCVTPAGFVSFFDYYERKKQHPLITWAIHFFTCACNYLIFLLTFNFAVFTTRFTFKI